MISLPARRPRSNRRAFYRPLLGLLILACLCGPLFADGKVFVRGTARVRIPDQSALICFDGKTERLVIETAFEGEGNEFAWIVPVPSVPKVEPATTGVFPTLRMITRARVIGHNELWWFWPLAGLVVCLLIWIGIWSRRWADVGLILIFFLVLAAVLLPALGTAGPGGTAAFARKDVVVHAREIVGVYDTVTLSAKDAGKLVEWLESHGFNVPPGVEPVAEQYARDGWVFVAARLRRSADEPARSVPHPLSFTFNTKRAVYPIRMTGVDNGPMTVDLYVVGNQEARAEHFARKRAARLDFERLQEHSRSWYGDVINLDDRVPVAHEKLRAWLKGFNAITRLSGTLSPEDMRKDVYLNWQPVRPYREIFHMQLSAVSLGAYWATAVLVATSVCCAFAYRRRYTGTWRRKPRTLGLLLAGLGIVTAILAAMYGLVIFFPCPVIGILVLAGSVAVFAFSGFMFSRYRGQLQPAAAPRPSLRLPAGLLLCSVVVGACIYGGLDKVPSGGAAGRTRRHNQSTHRDIVDLLPEPKPSDDPDAMLRELREQVRTIAADMAKKGRVNIFTGQPIREEDSPGNYTLGLDRGDPAYFFYDANGFRITFQLFVLRGRQPDGPKK